MSGSIHHSGKHPETQAESANTQSETRIAFRPLAPKPPDPLTRGINIRSQSTPSNQGSAVRRKLILRCHVCFKIDCKLLSHKIYARISKKPIPTDTAQISETAALKDVSFKASYAYKLAQVFIDRNVAMSKVDPFYDLPVPPEFNTIDMHRLFHEFFTIEAVDFFAIKRPYDMFSDLLFGPLIAPSLNDTALCLSILALAAASRSCREGNASKNVQSLTLMGRAMKEMREKVNDTHDSVADTTVAAASVLWHVNWYLDDTEALKQHGTGVVTFVRMRGGLNKLGMSGMLAQYVAWTDVCASLTHREKCYLAKLHEQPMSIQSTFRRYGSFWDLETPTESSDIDPLIIKACQNTAKLIEFFEHSEQKSHTNLRYQAILQYLNTVMNHNSQYQASYKDTGTLNECVILTLYVVLIRSFVSSKTRASSILSQYGLHLVKAIRECGNFAYWQSRLDLLTWMLLALLLVGKDFQHNEWCMRALCQAMESRYGRYHQWPSNWSEELKECVAQFVWCDLKLSGVFDTACSSIQEFQRAENTESDDED